MNNEELEQRIELIKRMRANPCPDGQHDYQDHLFATESMGTMMHVLCSKCLDMQGWIYNWEGKEG